MNLTIDLQKKILIIFPPENPDIFKISSMSQFTLLFLHKIVKF